MAKISRTEIIAHGWIFTEITDPYPGKPLTYPPLTYHREEKLLSEIHFGVHQKDTAEFLRNLEYCTRAKGTDLLIELSPTPPNSPGWLDDEAEYFDWPRVNFTELLIRRGSESYFDINSPNATATLYLTQEKTYELFSRIYICNTIYATGWDNLIQIDSQLEDGMRSPVNLVIWGVTNRGPIHY